MRLQARTRIVSAQGWEMNEGVESRAWSSFQSPKRLILCLGQVAQAKRPLAAILQDLLLSARSITSSGSHSRKELQSSTDGNKEGFPRASWPPRSPARADSTSHCLSSGCYREVIKLD